ncbi:uncharacterized protein K460DRAFT_365298 [Cucurbitaria berberidis CBS 394.84]|uniref:Uncharacterized protein n=1 Tax=Cucurbitaria berberidis CBS 394.84 TaxID=1168544 RepID=A0A9P4LC76_9PLEO|nr:uncharacterized protein K460DRAFT_365298 [Cucurbitaria berberidis CBS 394.84]KAF1849413.1 hypothetical protein K460DRAFT_365298 [Cucurbitaria berberidis CBS 394.84]
MTAKRGRKKSTEETKSKGRSKKAQKMSREVEDEKDEPSSPKQKETKRTAKKQSVSYPNHTEEKGTLAKAIRSLPSEKSTQVPGPEDQKDATTTDEETEDSSRSKPTSLRFASKKNTPLHRRTRIGRLKEQKEKEEEEEDKAGK